MVGISSRLMPAVGSSNIKTRGLSASRIATSSLRWSPCDSAADRKLGAGPELDAVEPVARLVAHRGVARGDAEKIEADLRDRLHREPHVLEHGEAWIEIDQLERAAEPEPGAVGRAEPGDVRAEQADAAAVGRSCPEIRLK